MGGVSDRSWERVTESDFTSSQWRASCLVDTGVGDPVVRSRYRLPVREPSGVLNRAAVRAAGHGIAAVRGISSDLRRSTARTLVDLFRHELNEEPPEGLLTMAGSRDVQDSPAVDTSTALYRSFVPDLEVRLSGDGRTVYGIAVPWAAPTKIDDELVEQFAPGAFNHQLKDAHRVKFEREHVELGGTLIGALTLMRNDPAGLYVEMRASRTPVGDETLELIKDGALDQLSIKFRERQNRRLAGGITERVKAHLAAVAVVMEGAYGDKAMAAGVRSAQVPAAAEDLDLRAQAEEFLLGDALPDVPDHDLAIRAIRLGMIP